MTSYSGPWNHVRAIEDVVIHGAPRSRAAETIRWLGKKWIVSMESFLHVDPYEFPAIGARLRDVFGESCRVVVGIREPREFLVSLYAQAVRSRLNVSGKFFYRSSVSTELRQRNDPWTRFDLDSFSYGRVLETFEKLFIEVVALPFPLSADQEMWRQNILRNNQQSPDHRWHQSPTIDTNSSISSPAIQTLRLYNRIPFLGAKSRPKPPSKLRQPIRKMEEFSDSLHHRLVNGLKKVEGKKLVLSDRQLMHLDLSENSAFFNNLARKYQHRAADAAIREQNPSQRKAHKGPSISRD